MRSDYKPVILLTSEPGSGKTTAVKTIVSLLNDESGGFYTQEVRSNGQRVGFEIVTIGGSVMMLAHKDRKAVSPNAVPFLGYWLDLDAVNYVAVPSLTEAMNENKVIVIDEIGPMEIQSEVFRDTVMRILENTNTAVVGTIVKRPYDFADTVKIHPRVEPELVELTSVNRNYLPDQICSKLVINQG